MRSTSNPVGAPLLGIVFAWADSAMAETAAKKSCGATVTMMARWLTENGYSRSFVFLKSLVSSIQRYQFMLVTKVDHTFEYNNLP